MGKINHQISRRDFLKLLGSASIAPLIRVIPPQNSTSAEPGNQLQNIIIILFDALSAFHLSLFGYKRQTSPNIEKFAERSIVYHNHHSAANFTTPSTASLFTSTYPWQHRAITLTGIIKPEVLPNNLLQLLSDKYYQVAFAQNKYADMLLYLFDEHLDRHLGMDSLGLFGYTFHNNFSGKDAVYAMKSYDQFLFKPEDIHGSLFLSFLNDLGFLVKNQFVSREFTNLQPNGLPHQVNTNVRFLLGEVMDGIMEMLGELPQPFFTYLHFFPPHDPYLPTSQFLGMFKDGWAPPAKERHPLSTGSRENYRNKRQTYDEYVVNLDAEFGRLWEYLETSGLIDNSYVLLMADHGELFERGTRGHNTPLLFEPVLHVPLLISTPGQDRRVDIFDLTSNVDIMPTLLHLAGLSVPETCVGKVLPGLGGQAGSDNIVWAMEAKTNPTQGPLDELSLTLIQNPYKLVYYYGYNRYPDNYEFYDIENDPEELENLYPNHPKAAELRDRLQEKFQEFNRPD